MCVCVYKNETAFFYVYIYIYIYIYLYKKETAFLFNFFKYFCIKRKQPCVIVFLCVVPNFQTQGSSSFIDIITAIKDWLCKIDTLENT